MTTSPHTSRILTLTLDLQLHAGEIPAFRGSIIELVGAEYDIFHNHDNSSENTDHFHYGYPLVQYSVKRRKATLVGLDAGADALQQVLIPKLMGQLQFAGRTHWFNGLQLQEQRHAWQLLEEPQQFGLYGWLALNQENYKDWKAYALPETRIPILERALTGHLRVLAKAVGIGELEQVFGKVVQVDNQKRAAFHGTQMVRFHALIESSLALPFGLCIGRAAAFGFGEVQPVAVYQRMMSLQPKTKLVES